MRTRRTGGFLDGVMWLGLGALASSSGPAYGQGPALPPAGAASPGTPACQPALVPVPGPNCLRPPVPGVLPQPAPTPTPAPAPSSSQPQAPAQQPGQQPQSAVSPQQQERPQEPAAPAEQTAAAGGEQVAFAPNMIGDLLMAGRSVGFDYATAGGNVRVFQSGLSSVFNPKIADNNSPLPRDRVSFRYNYFNRAAAVTGISSEVPTSDPRNLVGLGLANVGTQTRNYDVNQFTFQYEKTFFDGLMSLEVRLPFQHAVSPNLNLSAGTIVGTERIPTPPAATILGPQGQMMNRQLLTGERTIDRLLVQPTPENTLGSEQTQLANMSLIFKGLLYRSPQLAFSGGLAVGIPTAPNTSVHVTDFGVNLTSETTEIVRFRDFQVKNQTVSLSPFLAALYTPNARFFAQGFMQVDVPVNESEVTFSESAVILNPLANRFLVTGPNVRVPPFTVTQQLREQTLMQLDLGTGYWLVRDPSARWITGFAPSLELHYTGTLNDADLITLPVDSSAIPAPTVGQINTRAEATPTVGNRRNRLDIVNLTAGTTLLLAERATLTTAFSAPLNGGDNRTFDWEFHVQLNYFFGAPRSVASRFAPNF